MYISRHNFITISTHFDFDAFLFYHQRLYWSHLEIRDDWTHYIFRVDFICHRQAKKQPLLKKITQRSHCWYQSLLAVHFFMARLCWL